LVDVGLTEAERRRSAEYLSSGEYPPDDFCRSLSVRFLTITADELAQTRRQLIDDLTWFRSDTWDAYRQSGVSDILMSLVQIQGTERALCVGLTRDLGERGLGIRQARLVELFSRLARPHLGRELVRVAEPGIIGLSPRRREVLVGLLDGLAEKQVASRLGLSLPTVHEYVTDLYRYFGVSSRGELLALFLRRRNGPAREWLERLWAAGSRCIERGGTAN
jgi:DNA-binding CsgD family transcriptional regulator